MGLRSVDDLGKLPPLLSTGEVLRILQVSRRTLERIVASGRLPRQRLLGSVLVRYKREDVLALIVTS